MHVFLALLSLCVSSFSRLRQQRVQEAQEGARDQDSETESHREYDITDVFFVLHWLSHE